MVAYYSACLADLLCAQPPLRRAAHVRRLRRRHCPPQANTTLFVGGLRPKATNQPTNFDSVLYSMAAGPSCR